MSGGCAERAMCVRDHEEPTSAFVIPLLSRASKKAPPFAPPFVHALLFTPGWCASSAPGAEPEAFGGVLRLSLPGAPVARRAPPRLGPIPLLDRVGGHLSRREDNAGGARGAQSTRIIVCTICHANLSQAPPTVEVSAHAVVHGSDRSVRTRGRAQNTERAQNQSTRTHEP